MYIYIICIYVYIYIYINTFIILFSNITLIKVSLVIYIFKRLWQNV